MDAYLAGLFIITGTVVLVNVVLRRLENAGRDTLVQQLDDYAIRAYAISYALAIAGIAFALA